MDSKLIAVIVSALAAAGPVLAQTAAEIELQTKAAAARKAEAEAAKAELDLRNARMAVPNPGVSGRVTETAGAATGEERLLAARALNAVSDCIAPRVRASLAGFATSGSTPAQWMTGSGCDVVATAPAAPTGAQVILFLADERPTLDNWITFERRAQQLDTAFKEAERLFNEAVAGDPEMKNAGAAEMMGFLPGVGEVGTGIAALTNLIGYFGSEYSVGGSSIPPDNNMFEASLTRALLGQGVRVRRPGRAAPTAMPEAMADRFMAWDERTANAAARLAFAQARAKAYEKEPKRAAPWTKAAGALQNAAGGASALYAWLATADPKGGLVMGRVLAEQQLDADLKDERKRIAYLYISVSSASGSHYSRRNLWTVLGDMPFWTMGSVVVGYQLVDPKSGVTIAADQIPFHGGYMRIHRVPEAVPSAGPLPTRPPRERGRR